MALVVLDLALVLSSYRLVVKCVPAIEADPRRIGLSNAVLPHLAVLTNPRLCSTVLGTVEQLGPDLDEAVSVVALEVIEVFNVNNAKISRVALAPSVLLCEVRELQAGSQTRIAVIGSIRLEKDASGHADVLAHVVVEPHLVHDFPGLDTNSDAALRAEVRVQGGVPVEASVDGFGVRRRRFKIHLITV